MSDTENGIQYEIIQNGSAISPSLQDIVYISNNTEVSNNGGVIDQYDSLLASINSLNERFTTVIDNQATIIENQDIIIKNLQNFASNESQLAIIQQLAKFEAMWDTIAGNISTKTCLCKTKILNIVEENIDIMDPIDSLEDLMNLEKKLTDRKVMEEYIQKLSYLCGKKGNGHGPNNCYLLVDRLFTRKFMTLCSWAGGAREQKEKIAFKTYKNVINFFFNIIHLSDENFTLKDCEEFFKNVIRNSTRRNESSMCRSSRIKRRPKQLSYKIKGLSQLPNEKDCEEKLENEETIGGENVEHTENC